MKNDITKILEENAKALLAPPEVKPPPKKMEPKIVPDVVINYSSDPWFEAKKEFLANTEVKVTELAKKFNLPLPILIQKIKQEGWEKQRQNIFARADAKAQNLLENNAADIKARHALVGKMLQKVGLKSIKSWKVTLGPKDALQYLVEGVKLERDAHGLGQNQPKIVNIITQQQAIIDKYRKNNE